MNTTEELLMEAVNEHLYRTQVREVKDNCAYNLYTFEMDNNNITQSELNAISEIVGDDDLSIDIKDNWLYVIAEICDERIEEIRSLYEE